MDFYTPLFSKIVDSSIWDESDCVVKVYLTMLAKKDRDQVVRGNAYNIAAWSRKTEAEVIEALKVLGSPDTRRLEPQPHEGRRIERVEDGWLILNGRHYQDQMQVVNRRAYKAGKEKERRDRRKVSGKSVSDYGEAAHVRLEENGASQAQLDAHAEEHLPEQCR
jgi:hypothetical protein